MPRESVRKRRTKKKLKIGVVPGEQGMHAELMLNDEEIESIEPCPNGCKAGPEPHYYWTLDLPSLEPLQQKAKMYLPPTSVVLPYTEYHNTLQYKLSPGPDSQYDAQIHRLGPQRLTLQHLYVTKSGNAVCSVIQSEKIQEVNRMPNPHVSVAHNDNTDWRDLGRVLRSVETDRYEKTGEAQEGWLQGRRTKCMRYTLGWVMTTMPKTHLSDGANVCMTQNDNE